MGDPSICTRVASYHNEAFALNGVHSSPVSLLRRPRPDRSKDLSHPSFSRRTLRNHPQLHQGAPQAFLQYHPVALKARAL